MRSPGHETVLAGFLLSLAGGFLDAYTFLLKDGVFANAQTGNVVLMAMALTDPSSGKFVKYLFPLTAFILGIALTEVFRLHRRTGTDVLWIRMVLVLEIVLLGALAFVSGPVGITVTVTVVSFVAALQVQAFRRVGEAPYATTMITGNLRSGLELLIQGSLKKDRAQVRKAGLYALMILGFGTGALAGALLCRNLGDLALTAVCVPLVVVGLLTYRPLCRV